MLWDLIYSFYVMYIFGGTWNEETYYSFIGGLSTEEGLEVNIPTQSLLGLKLDNIFDSDFPYLISLGNYLSLIATIITMIIILIVIGHFIKKAFNLFGRII